MEKSNAFLFMKNNRKYFYIIGIVCFTIFLLIDQYTKALAVKALQGKNAIPLIKDVLEFNYLENRGAAWGMLQDGTYLFATVSIIAVIVIVFYFLYLPYTKKYNLIRIAFVFLAAGSVGNLIDRLKYHYVIDFIYFKIINFPVFNVADIYVTCSIALIAIIVLFVFADEDLDAFKIRKN